MRKITMLYALLCIGFAVKGQEKITTITDSLKEINLNEITLAATKFEENKKYLAQQVQTISAKKIAFYNQQTTAELLTHTGNVFVQKSQLGGGSPVMRGFEANKILITVDGVRLNNAIFRGGHLQNVITIDNAILEKTEILYGPASVIYGSDALGGVLSFYTKSPKFSSIAKKTILSGNASLRYASAYDEKNGHIDFSIGTKKFASLTSFTFSDFGDMKQGSHYYADFPNWGKRTFYVSRINGVDSMITNKNQNKQVQTGYKQYDLLQKFVLQTGRIQHIVNLQFSRSSDIFRYDRLTETTGAGIARSAEWYYGPQQRLLAAWQMSLPSTKIFDKAQVITSFQDSKESRHNRNYRSTKLNHRNENVKAVILNADFFKKIKNTELSYGTELTYNKVNSTAYAENIATGVESALDTRYPDGGSNTQSYAAYAMVLQKFSPKFIFNAGLRFSHYRLFSKFNDRTFFPFPYNQIEQESNSISGNAGLVFLPGPGWKISALVATGFRTPNVDDMAKVFESTGGTIIVPNPDIKPEKTLNYEIGVLKNIAGKWQIGVTGWYTLYNNILTTDFGTFNGSSTIIYNGVTSNVITVVNKNKAFSYGISANIAADISKHFSFYTGINYTYGRIKENPKNYPLDHVPPTYGKTSVTGRFGKFTAEIFALYNTKKDSADYNLRGEDNQVYSADVTRGYTPGWFTANLRASYELNKYCSLQFAVENIADKFYRVFASGLSAPGRNFVITLRTKM